MDPNPKLYTGAVLGTRQLFI